MVKEGNEDIFELNLAFNYASLTHLAHHKRKWTSSTRLQNGAISHQSTAWLDRTGLLENKEIILSWAGILLVCISIFDLSVAQVTKLQTMAFQIHTHFPPMKLLLLLLKRRVLLLKWIPQDALHLTPFRQFRRLWGGGGCFGRLWNACKTGPGKTS